MGNTKFNSYQEVLDFLYTQLPMFQRVGASAFKKDLTNTIALCEFLGHPEHQFKSVHVAGTNGKGSSSHFLTGILQSAGYKTGLYTSPHLKSFTERIKINGQEIPEHDVVNFINKVRPVIDDIQPSFFEITVAMAFDYFAINKVDIAMVEVGMGGRLDSTNVVIPEVSLITNISNDHQQWLGDTLPLIAGEKAGIIKERIPVVISQRQSEDIASVFIDKAKETSSSICFASDEYKGEFEKGELVIENKQVSYRLNPPLKGSYQVQNLNGVIKTLDILNNRGFTISSDDILDGVARVTELTNFKGRWQVLQSNPKVICDVGHNEAGVRLLMDQLTTEDFEQLHIVWGMVSDKDVKPILSLLPKSAHYYFCQPDIPRAMAAIDLQIKAGESGLNGVVVQDVNEALEKAISQASSKDLIFIGGSTFVVAEIRGL